jgi:5-methylcytosine-specific restriction endonuclease McrA
VKGPRRPTGDIRNRIYGSTWRKVRLEILQRDGYKCQIRLPGCTGKADRVDHVVPVDRGGAWYAESNLRASCRSCNGVRVRRLDGPSGVVNPSRAW